MKYIKKFESHNTNIQLKIGKDISDIFVELQDEGFTVRNNIWYEDGRSVTVTISKPEFNTDEIKEYVMMFIDYMKSYFGNVSVNYVFKTRNSRAMTLKYPDNEIIEIIKINIGKNYKENDLYKL
jgi:hypothetical protein